MVDDKMAPLWPVEIEFVPGEQLEDTKLTGWALQTGAGLTKLSRAVGDLWGDYFADNKLDIHYYAPPNIANLARITGPTSLLNPVMPSRETVTVTFDPANIPTLVHQFNMKVSCNAPPYLEWSSTDKLFASLQVPTSGGLITKLTEVDGTVFATFVSTVAGVNAAGKFNIDTQGTVTCYLPTPETSYPSSSKTYDTVLAPDMYDGASMNVIPDPFQSTTRCTVSTLSGGFYTITLPEITVTPLPNTSSPGYGVSCSSSSLDIPPETYQARLPSALIDTLCMNLNEGDIVPAGFMYLLDTTTNQFVNGLTFYIAANDYTVKAAGATLTASTDRYCLVTVGTSITGAISDISRRLYSHDHTTPGGGRPLYHYSLLNTVIPPKDILEIWSIEVQVPHSGVPGNDHPQYLCRYGWNSSLHSYDPSTLCANAMLGDLFMAAAFTDYITGASPTNYSSLGVDSRRIYFGHVDRYLWHDATTAGLTLEGTDLVLNVPGTSRYLSFYNSGNMLQLGYKSGTGYGLFLPTGNTGDLFIYTLNAASDIFIESARSLSLSSLYAYLSLYTSFTLTTGTGGSSTSGSIYAKTSLTLTGVTGITLQTATNKPSLVLGSSSFTLTTGSSGTTGTITAEGDLLLSTRTGSGGHVHITSDGPVGIAAGAGVSDIELYVARTIIIPNSSGHPAAGSEINGMMYYDTGDNRLHIYNGGWKTVLLS